MTSFNRVTILGTLGKDPIIRNFDENSIASFSVATNESWVDKKTNEKKQLTDWHNIQIKNPSIVPYVEKYLKKGDTVLIEGELKNRKYKNKDNVDVYITEVVVKPFKGSLQKINTKNSDSSNQKSIFFNEIVDDDIPF